MTGKLRAIRSLAWVLASLMIAAVGAGPRAFAQQRPLLTEDPRLPAEGTVILEQGVAYLHRARFPVSGLGGNEFSILVSAIHVGVGSRAEFQIGGVAQNFLSVTEGGTGRRNDWGDGWISTKVKLLSESARRPALTFRYTVVLPNSNTTKGIGTDGTHFFGGVLFGKKVGRAYVFGNLGLGILDDAVRAAAQQDVFTYGIAASLPLNSRWSALAEVNGLSNPQQNPSPGGEDRSQARLGVQAKAAGLRWDAAVTAGLTRWDHKAGFVVGFTKELQLWH